MDKRIQRPRNANQQAVGLVAAITLVILGELFQLDQEQHPGGGPLFRFHFNL